jgi:hypothetical protein
MNTLTIPCTECDGLEEIEQAADAPSDNAELYLFGAMGKEPQFDAPDNRSDFYNASDWHGKQRGLEASRLRASLFSPTGATANRRSGSLASELATEANHERETAQREHGERGAFGGDSRCVTVKGDIVQDCLRALPTRRNCESIY